MTRAGCCEDWPKPCSYHEGWQDAADMLGDDLAEAVELLRACHPERLWQSSVLPQTDHERRVYAFLDRITGAVR